MPATKSYTIPPYGSGNAAVAGFLREAVQEGDSWLATQKPATEWQEVIERIGARGADQDLAGQSNAEYNKSERLVRDIVSSLGTFSHVGETKPRSRQDLDTQAGVLTKLDHSWGKLEETYDAHRRVLQNAVALGTSYGWQTWDKHFHGEYQGDIRLVACAPGDVTFVQLPRDHDIQRAYITLVREELPINLAKRIYARTNRGFADALVPDRDSPGWLQKGLRKVQEFISPALRVAGKKPGDEDTSFPTVDIFHAYILDGSINETGHPITMGAHGTNWSYTVPSVGDPLPTGLLNRATGQMFTRPAEYEDCLLFPLRRYCIFSRSTEIVAYDGSSPWWHGMTPVVRFRFNDWPWEALGRSCIGMIRTLESSSNAILQGIEDSVAARLDPPALYNDQAVSPTFANNFNPRKAGVRAAADLNQGEILKFPVDAKYYDVPNWIFEVLKWEDERMEYLTGARDLTAMAQAKQIPSSDSMEKLLEMAGPLVQDMVRGVTMPLKQLGTMRIAYFLQFYTAERILSSTNADDEPEDWLYTPEVLLGRVPGEAPEATRSRSRKLLTEFRYSVSQSGVSEINRMTTKLFYLQLMKLGFPIDWWTFAKIAQLPRFGMEPKGTSTILERYIAQLRMMQEFRGDEPGAEGQGGPGRPPSGHKPPHLVQKDGGTRSTVATS
jgi:hypothetical protein